MIVSAASYAAPVRIVAYTAAFGSQPPPHPQPIDIDVPMVCFTDRPDLQAPGYEVRVVSPAFPEPRLASRYIKIMAHEVLEPVDWSIWFDAEVIFKTGRLTQLVASVAPSTFATHAHPVRRCIYVEAAVCKNSHLDDPRRIDALTARYRAQGHPARAGLFENSLLVRRLTDPDVVGLNEAWWRDVLCGSVRDQISLPVVARQLGVAVHVLSGWVYDNPFSAMAPGPMSPMSPTDAVRVCAGSQSPDRWTALRDPAPPSIFRRARHRLAIWASGLFEPDFYREQAGPAAGRSPLGHYLTVGWRQNLDPHPLFDVSFYLERSPDVLQSGVEPLGHYIHRGGREGRSPHALFDVARYVREYGRKCSDMEGGALSHYVTRGWRRGFRPNTWFDPVAYLRIYPDIAQADIEPFGHFLRYGGREGRISSNFDAH